MEILILFSFLGYASAIGIQNAVVGQPEVECLQDSISVNFNTEAPYTGVVYVKTLRGTEGCSKRGEGDTSTSFVVNFNDCGVTRERSTEPAGVAVKATIVVGFHRAVLTKIDRAIRLQCFYMESEKSDGAELEASVLTTAIQRGTIPMPVCRYDVLQSRENQIPVEFALVGDKVYHKWTCDTETVDAFCMEIHTCFIDGGNGRKLDLIDGDGCALDGNLLQNLEYVSDLMAGQDAHVFKFADSSTVSFDCQIRLDAKGPNETCEAFRGDACPPPPLARNKRALNPPGEGQPRVTSRPMLVGGVEISQRSVPEAVHHPSSYPIEVSEDIQSWTEEMTGFCMDLPFYGLLLAVTTIFVLLALSASLAFCFWGFCCSAEEEKPIPTLHQWKLDELSDSDQ